MGVYIDMEMPKDCIVCPFGWNGCNNQHDFVYMGSRPDNCPLIEVPEPHGRLIDADALEYEEAYLNGHYELGDVEIVTREDIESAPTIIPASESKERPAFLPTYELTPRREEAD